MCLRLEDRTVPTTFNVTNTDDSGTGSLRQAILAANGSGGPDEIHFNIPGAGVHTITPLSQLPGISGPVIIDGYTQPGASANTNGPGQGDNAVLQIEINGANGNQNGLVLGDLADVSTIRGLVINNGFSIGISISANKVTVEGCFIGVDPTGTIARGNSHGIFFEFGQDTANGLVGGTTPAARNVISGNNSPAIFIQSGNQTIQGNLIGTDATGLIGIPNPVGVQIQGISNCVIGGSTPAARNVINASSTGVNVGSCSGTKIQGNFIQLLVDGVTPGASANNAISLELTSSSQIGGLTSTPGTGPGNVIGRAVLNGIQLTGANDIVQGNLIGTDATGTKAVGIGQNGILITDIGIGSSGDFNTIGGATVDARNVISACAFTGVRIIQATHDNLVQNNFIGTNVNGVPNSLGNGEGVFLQSATNNQIINNVVAGNAGRGVDINTSVTNTALQGNSIFANGGLGIDLIGGLQNAFGVTDNDPGDVDTGPNGLQNYPVITSNVILSGNFNITGTLNSTPNTTFLLEFFAGTADASGFGEGQAFLASKSVTTDSNGDVGFSATLPVSPGIGHAITVTATDPAGNTSEFSAALAAQAPPEVTTVIVNHGDVQRSRVTSVEVDFDQIVSLPATPTSAFTLKRQSDNAIVTLGASVDNSGNGTKVTLTFIGGAVDNVSLKDGRYTLTALQSQISSVAGQLDGNADGTGGDDFVLVGNPSNAPKLYRMYGDVDGDGSVFANDFISFRLAFSGIDDALDFDGDGFVSASDFVKFRQRFNTSI